VAINPSSDLVLDVISAADPTRAEAVKERLVALGATTSAGGDDFASVLQASASPESLSAPPDLAAANARARLTDPSVMKQHKEKQAGIDFETSILSSFMRELMPKNTTDVYGQGTAGEIWKSMLADQIAHQVAASGVLGISKRLFATHGILHDPAEASGAAGKEFARATQASSNPLSISSRVDIENGAVLFNDRKSS
jgi:peptidoglycan hydrolase FlgJ